MRGVVDRRIEIGLRQPSQRLVQVPVLRRPGSSSLATTALSPGPLTSSSCLLIVGDSRLLCVIRAARDIKSHLGRAPKYLSRPHFVAR